MRRLIVVCALSLTVVGAEAQAQITVPTNASNTCGVSSQTLQTWFGGAKSITSSTSAVPAQSTSFTSNPNFCDFYQWASQMFLWLTSPTTTSSGSSYVFLGPSFFNVVDYTGSGFTYTVNTGSSGTSSGAVAETKSAPLMLKLRKSKPAHAVSIASSTGATNSEGQAGDQGTLIPQASSATNPLVTYYGIHVNDVYAYLRTLTQTSGSGFSMSAFPTTATQVNSIQSAAQALSMAVPPFQDGVAAAMEIKTSWVEASAVSNPSQYVQINATVPTFTQETNNTWVQTGTSSKNLVLVGMHVVGSANNHPEMIWASFEHVNNAPNFPFTYTNNATPSSQVVNAYTSTGAWTFAPANYPQPPNPGSNGVYVAETASVVPSNTCGGSGNATTIQGSSCTVAPTATSVARINPWGSAPTDANAIQNNTDMVSLNASIQAQLASGDVRANYVLLGAVWGAGVIPSGSSSGVVGTLSLANSTMETFFQYPDNPNTFVPQNCFGCHSGNSSFQTSHVYDLLQGPTLP